MRKIALDLGVRKICFCEVEGGRVIDRATVSSLDELEGRLGPESPSATVAVEACREAWAVMDTLEGWGNQAVLVDTTRVHRIGINQHGRKTDRIDAELLARALESGQLPVAHRLSFPRQQLRHWLSIRGALVESRAKVINSARGVARAYGQRLPKCEATSFARRVREATLDDATRAFLAPAVAAVEGIDVQLLEVEIPLEKICLEDEAILRLATTPGVAKVVGATFVSVIDDPKRFRSAHQVESYLGLVPSEMSSGGGRRLGSITKCGNVHARTMLVEAAWCIYRSKGDDPLKLWARALAKRRGRATIAVVALARRLAGVLWAMWRRGTTYDPGRVALSSAAGLHGAARSTNEQADALARAALKIKRLAKQAERGVRRQRPALAQGH